MNYSITALPKLESKRIMLRAIEEHDLYDMYDYAKREHVGPMAGWPKHERIDITRQIISNMKESQLTDDNIGVFAIIFKADNRMIGTVGLHNLNQREERATLGYVLNPDYWGQGIMSEACKVLITWCFETLKLVRLECTHYDFNQQSKRVIEKLGFKFEGISRKRAVLPNGARCDSYNYSILKSEYDCKQLPWQN